MQFKHQKTPFGNSAHSALFFLSIFIFFQGSGISSPAGIHLQKFASGFEAPVQIIFPEKRNDLSYVVEQKGRIYKLKGKNKTVFLDIQSAVGVGSELGLLSMALKSDYSEKDGDQIYINYTTPRPYHTVIASIPIKNGIPDQTQMRIILKFAQPYSNHNGGLLLFGPDGGLFIGTGDGGSGGDPQNNAQNTGNFLGKILRIYPDESKPEKYSIPKDNPLIKGKRSEIFAYGLRNPWRFSFDRKTGLLYAGDVGQDRKEEINLIESGKNYGWRIMEGDLCYNPENSCPKEGLTNPIYAYGRSNGISVTGGYVYRGNSINELTGYYLFSDFGSGNVWGLKLNSSGLPESSKPEILLDSVGNISSFGEDSSGEIYLVEYRKGIVYKIIK